MTRSAADPEIVPLRDLRRYKVADSDSDVRGWDVFDGDGARIGTVDDLLVDPAAEQVRYLAVSLSPELSGGPAPQGGPDPVDSVPLAGMAALGAAVGQGIAGNPVAAGLIPGLATSSTLLGEPAGPFGLGTTPAEAAFAMPAEADSRRILIPISRARLDPAALRVTVDGLRASNPSDIAALPEYGE